MENVELARILKDLHAFLLIAGQDPTYASRYAKLADDVARWHEPVELLRREGRLKDLPGVGKTVQATLKELMDTGTCTVRRFYEGLVPFSIVELTRLPGIGPFRARALYELLGISSVEELNAAIRDGKIDRLPDPGLAEIAKKAVAGP